ncbi:hypothetical protein C5S53_11790 [Methanophagales archaeon]|nr:hypothetical protein C5S53_11790 [Methanophagales archaeon]
MILNNEGKEKPTWITEFVFPTGGNKDFLYSEENQAGVLTWYLALMFVNGSVMVTAVEEPQYLVEFKQSRNKKGFEYVVVTKGQIVREKYRYHRMSENDLNV